MPASPVIDDLFGHVPQQGAAQRDLEDRLADRDWCHPREADWLVRTPHVPDSGEHSADTIRTQVMKILGFLRGANSMPFGPEELRNHTVWMPYYCEWLKHGEGDSLLAEYREHVDRLTGPGS